MSHRLQKLNVLIKEELAKIILEEEEFDPDVLVTVLDVKTTADLKEASATISVFPDQKGKDVFQKLLSHIFHLQQMLNKILLMRPVPKLRFILNKDEAKAQKIDTLIAEVKQQKTFDD